MTGEIDDDIHEQLHSFIDEGLHAANARSLIYCFVCN